MKYAYTASYTTESKVYKLYPSGDGLHVYRISPDGEVWDEIQTVVASNPAFIGFDMDKKVVYAAHSNSPVPVPGITAYSVDKETGLLTAMEKQLDFGCPICCFSVHPSNRYMVAADFKGNVYTVKLDQNGALDEITDTIALEGTTGPLTNIQKCSRPHHIPFDLDGNFLVIPDKGFDKVHVYRLDLQSGKLEKVSETPVRPGACVRHVAFHPNRKAVYIVAEYTSSVYVFDYDSKNGLIELRQIISSERSTYCGMYTKASEIEVHPNGKFLYVSNRGDDTIGIFSIDADTGLLTPIEWKETDGGIPRFFCLSEDGSHIYVGNQKSANVADFLVDSETGKLTRSGGLKPVPCPTWILFSD